MHARYAILKSWCETSHNGKKTIRDAFNLSRKMEHNWCKLMTQSYTIGMFIVIPCLRHWIVWWPVVKHVPTTKSWPGDSSWFIWSCFVFTYLNDQIRGQVIVSHKCEYVNAVRVMPTNPSLSFFTILLELRDSGWGDTEVTLLSCTNMSLDNRTNVIRREHV